MKFLATVAMAVMVSSAAAYTQADIPACAKPCAADAAKQVGCASDDTKCICSKADDIQTKATKCVLDSCSSEDAMKAAQVARDICQ